MIVCKYYMNVFRRGENSLRCLDFFNDLPVLDLGGGAHSLGIITINTTIIVTINIITTLTITIIILFLMIISCCSRYDNERSIYGEQKAIQESDRDLSTSRCQTLHC